ncbi:MAG: pyridoxal phosphate-dependent aminotransferase [Cyanobacteria bacterium J007]|nr:MAG: pyridoxal phosphate-dependent aminotransferase [Cyanobacteria bacterium J007]
MQFAKRLERIPPYLFVEIDRKRAQLLARGVDIINLGVGDPDKPTPTAIREAMHEAIEDPATHNYPPYQGIREFREAAIAWMERRFGVGGLDPDREAIASIGSKEAIHNTFLAFVDPGDCTLIPDPGYPVYRTATLFAGGEPYAMPLKAENGFLPDLTAIPETVARRAKLLWVNYPNNPTGAVAPLAFFEKLVAFCRDYEILLCHDHAYSEVGYDGYRAPSVLQVPGAKEVAIEFHSLSKSYNMTGWRIGFVVGAAIGIKGLSQVKSNVDSGAFKAIQRAAIAAFSTPEAEVQAVMSVYQQRRDFIVAGLQELGWPLAAPQATLYVWAAVPPGYTSSEFANLLLDRCGIVVPPGNGYGAAGEGFFRIALTVSQERMAAALDRMKAAGIRYERSPKSSG